MAKSRLAREGSGAATALSRALRFEKAGKKLFTAAAAKSADPFAKGMFELLAGLEEKHMADIREIAGKLEETGKFPSVSSAPHEARMRMFKREQSRIRREMIVSADAATVMRKALGFEAEGREMYLRLSRAATHAQEKKFFRLLSTEENSHFELIFEYLDFLEAQGLRMQDG